MSSSIVLTTCRNTIDIGIELQRLLIRQINNLRKRDQAGLEDIWLEGPLHSKQLKEVNISSELSGLVTHFRLIARSRQLKYGAP